MIITISREFGSGGRELGKRLSDELQIPYYDKEIIAMIAQNHGVDENYVAQMAEKKVMASYPLTIGNRFQSSRVSYAAQQAIRIHAEQQKIIESLGKQGDCIIVGRCADVILKDFRPFNMFVYAGKEAKLRRCLSRSPETERLSTQELARKIRAIDKARAGHRALFTDTKWGAKENYHLCVNTTGVEIKSMIPALAAYIRTWFSETTGRSCAFPERNPE